MEDLARLTSLHVGYAEQPRRSNRLEGISVKRPLVGSTLDSEEGLSAGCLVEGAVGPAAVGIEGMYPFRTGKESVSGTGFASKEFRAKGEGPRRGGFRRAKDSAKLDAVFAGALVDPAKGEFGGYVSSGAIGAGAYVSYSGH